MGIKHPLKNCSRDIVDRFGADGNDGNAKIVNDHAGYPSKTEQLEKEIKESCAW